MVNSDMSLSDLESKLKIWNAFQYERVGLNLRPELVALKDSNGDQDAFAQKAKMVAENSEFNLVLMSENKDVMAAGYFSGDDVGIFVKKSGIVDRVKHTELTIPGFALAIASDLEEELAGWSIVVGPREAAHIPAFLKERQKK